MIDNKLEGVRIMWHRNYFDGVLSGALLYNDEIHFFDMLEQYDPDDNPNIDDELDWYRKFVVYKLSGEDKLRLITLHALWQANVGLHCDYYPFNGRRMLHEKSDQKKIATIHNGPNKDFKTAWDSYDILKLAFEQKYGKFNKKNCQKIGWVYYDQLFEQQNKKDE